LYVTLPEVLLAATLGMALMASGFRLAHQSWRFCRESLRQTWMNQEVLVLRKAWRGFVHACPATGWEVRDGAFQAGTCRSAVTGRVLALEGEGGKRRLSLPKGMTGAVSIEREDGLADSAVLTLSWTSSFFDKARNHHVRLAACAPRPGGGGAPASGDRE